MVLTPCLALLAALALPPAVRSLPAARLAMQSPWWEHYEQRDRFLCPNRSTLVLERNDSQASLISGGSQLILFREDRGGSGLRYRNGEMRVILRGDELTFERLPMKLVCLRTERV